MTLSLAMDDGEFDSGDGGGGGGSGSGDGSGDGGDGGGRESDGGVGGGRGDDSDERRRRQRRRRWIRRRRATAMAEAARACSNRRRVLIGSWVTPPATGAIEIKRGGDENITINHSCGGGDCGGGGNRGGDDGGDGSNGGGIESEGSVGCGRSLSLPIVAATGAAKTKETMKTITAVAKATAGASTAMMTTYEKRT